MKSPSPVDGTGAKAAMSHEPAYSGGARSPSQRPSTGRPLMLNRSGVTRASSGQTISEMELGREAAVEFQAQPAYAAAVH
jgi:hypothetical protein